LVDGACLDRLFDVCECVLCARGRRGSEVEGARVVDCVHAHRAVSDLRAQRVDKRLPHPAEPGRTAGTAREHDVNVGAGVGIRRRYTGRPLQSAENREQRCEDDEHSDRTHRFILARMRQEDAVSQLTRRVARVTLAFIG